MMGKRKSTAIGAPGSLIKQGFGSSGSPGKTKLAPKRDAIRDPFVDLNRKLIEFLHSDEPGPLWL
jgi:hypothetical protein